MKKTHFIIEFTSSQLRVTGVQQKRKTVLQVFKLQYVCSWFQCKATETISNKRVFTAMEERNEFPNAASRPNGPDLDL